jgi:16S rRNA G966 N2-methylase RsmD
MNTQLLLPEVQAFLAKHAQDDPARIAMQKSPFKEVNARDLANQIDSRQRLSRKMPTWTATPGLLYPERISVEQCSSEKTAAYKAFLLRGGQKGLDMTGGLGIDTYALSQVTERVLYAERNEALAALVAHNFKVLQAPSIEIHQGDSEDLLRSLPSNSLDWIYIDPARRQETRKVFLLEQCEPNVLQLAPLLFDKTSRVLLKLSPMLDLHQAFKQLETVAEAHILSVDQECKEVLIEWRKEASVTQIYAKALSMPGIDTFRFTLEEEQLAQPTFSGPQRYLYDPDVALTKAGAFKSTAIRYDLAKLHPHTHLYTSEEYRPDFMGQIFEIVDQWSFGTFKKSKRKGKASITARHFPIRAEVLKQQFKWDDDPQFRLFFMTGPESQLLTVLAKQIPQLL